MTAIVQVSAGRGPVEVQAFAAELGAFLVDWVLAAGGCVEELVVSEGSVRFRADGVQLGPFIGTHELVDPVRGRRKRRRWFCDVAVYEPPELAAFTPDQVVFRASRSGGPGGQHVNTTSSAVRAVHVPSGLAVRVTSQRSQQRNRVEALRQLESQWRAGLVQQKQVLDAQIRGQHDAVVRGAPVASWRRRRGQLVDVR